MKKNHQKFTALTHTPLTGFVGHLSWGNGKALKRKGWGSGESWLYDRRSRLPPQLAQ